ncbi:GbpC/Spa domain-containing protein [Streptococcus ferus]|uniref:GbpC/Spa domain-containing protein n=1 Tax=Streptococcus ferus TaxID=1345 RepID=UPI003513ADD9
MKLQKFGFTKTKAYGLCGAVLASMIFATAQVSADEMTSPVSPQVAQVADSGAVLVQSSDLTEAVTNAQNAGATVTQGQTETVANEAAAQADYANQVAAINQVVQDKAQEVANYEAEKANVEAENAQITQSNADKKAAYEQALADYEAEKANVEAENKAIAQRNADKKTAYEQALAEAEANKDKDGYLSEVTSQILLFDDGTGAVRTITSGNKVLTADEAGQEVETLLAGHSSGPFLALNARESVKAGDEAVVLKMGESVTVEYTNLPNAILNGVKIGKVKYIYTLKEAPKGSTLLLISADPTVTVKYHDYYDKVVLNMDVTFYDEAGQEIDPTGALIAFSTLNKTTNSTEFVQSFNGRFIEITGSSIKVHGDGAYADSSNSYKSEGSKYDAGEWDVENNPLEYFGAIAGQAIGHINFDFGAENRGYIWYAFNSKVKATGIPTVPIYEQELPLPILPVEPIYDPLKELPQEPAPLTVTYHLNQYVPEVPAPEQPEPVMPTKATPLAEQSVVTLPQTGEDGSWVAVVSGLGMAVFGLVSIRKRKV